MSSRESGVFNRNRNFGCGETARFESSESGFTLIEIMVAFLIIIIAIIPLLALFVSGMNASRTNSYATEANSISSTNLEFDSAIPPSLIGYYADEFSSADPFYPTSPGPAQTEFATLFGSLSFPTNISYGRTVELSATSPGGQSQYDLIQPVKTNLVEGTTYYTYTFVTGVDTNSLEAGSSTPISCAYRNITVSTYWNQWTQVETQSTEVYSAGSGITGQCTPSGGSTTPSAPTVWATAATNSPAINVSWVGSDPNVGTFVVEWSTDSNFTTDVQTSPVLSPGLPAINPTNCVITSTTPCRFNYTISPLSYNSTYFVEIWSYSLDGTSASISSQIDTAYSPVSTSGGATTMDTPSTLSSCYVSSIFATAIVPGSVTTPASGTPVPASNGELTGKLYLTPSGSSAEDIYVGANITNGCQSSIGPQMFAGLEPYNTSSSSGGLQLSLNNYFSPGNSSNTSGVMYNIIPLSTSASSYAKAELYLITLDNGTGFTTPPPGLSLVTTTFLICPYIPIPDRAEATNKC
ncbi:MAG: hypothetical protein HKL80_00575 [Acidimicrobiales bacterium]|nr:hypothetical protein [Acidimicrobiales bacterium]